MKSEIKYPLDIDACFSKLMENPTESSGFISDPCVALTDDNRVIIAEFSVSQDFDDDGNVRHHHEWTALYEPYVGDYYQDVGIDYNAGEVGVNVVKWEFINFLKSELIKC